MSHKVSISRLHLQADNFNILLNKYLLVFVFVTLYTKSPFIPFFVKSSACVYMCILVVKSLQNFRINTSSLKMKGSGVGIFKTSLVSPEGGAVGPPGGGSGSALSGRTMCVVCNEDSLTALVAHESRPGEP